MTIDLSLQHSQAAQMSDLTALADRIEQAEPYQTIFGNIHRCDLKPHEHAAIVSALRLTAQTHARFSATSSALENAAKQLDTAGALLREQYPISHHLFTMAATDTRAAGHSMLAQEPAEPSEAMTTRTETGLLPPETVAWAFIDHHQLGVEIHEILTDLVRRARNDMLPFSSTRSEAPHTRPEAKAGHLLPCPFCGEKPFVSAPHGLAAQIACRNDDCFGPRTTAATVEDCTKQWNTRSNPSHAQLAAARSALEPFAKAAENYADSGSYDRTIYIDHDATVSVANLRDARAAHSTLAQELGASERFLLEWLSKEDSSAYGECKGGSLDALIKFGFAKIDGNPGAVIGDYSRVSLTDAGITKAKERRTLAQEPAGQSEAHGEDIVQELRRNASGDGIVFDKPVLTSAMRRAADEIERLRALLPAGSASPGVTKPVAWRRRRKGAVGDGGWIMCPLKPEADREFELQALYAHLTVKASGDAEPDEYFRDDPMFNKGVLHAQAILNKQIGNPDYVASDGSEDYDTDLGDTILNQLAAAGLYDKEEGRFATLPRSAEINAEAVANCPFCHSTDFGLRSKPGPNGSMMPTSINVCSDCESEWIDRSRVLPTTVAPEAAT